MAKKGVGNKQKKKKQPIYVTTFNDLLAESLNSESIFSNLAISSLSPEIMLWSSALIRPSSSLRS